MVIAMIAVRFEVFADGAFPGEAPAFVGVGAWPHD
jgi:hypothetical protein